MDRGKLLYWGSTGLLSLSHTGVSEEFVVKKYKKNPQSRPRSCVFTNLPKEIRVLAGGSYSSPKRLEYPILGGGAGDQYEVIVNSPDKPVALILGSYTPSIWNVSWTKKTKTVAVLASGYHIQYVAGVPKNTPVITTSHDSQGPCGSGYVRKNDSNNWVHSLSKKLFGTPPKDIYISVKENLTMGEELADNVEIISSRAIPPQTFLDKSRPRSGKGGLKDGIPPCQTKDCMRWESLTNDWNGQQHLRVGLRCQNTA